jgi:hypothetical protein
MSICEKCHIKIHQEEHHLNVQESKSGLNFLDDNCSVLTEPTISPSLPKKKIVRKKKTP